MIDLSEGSFSADKLNALRLGRSLVAEVHATRPECRAWVAVHPVLTEADHAAQHEGWTRSDVGRAFRLIHREYLTKHLDGWDYDIGSSEIKRAVADGEAGLLNFLRDWGMAPDQFAYPWDTDYPE
ncbi:hypothetical protein [Nonomuraea roseola]|uniref:Uncharacterized protein n=1 Tax=Nonomuraea roseola TaxID=46179 RepID=A0ABV5Q2X8_9ACTN